VGRPSDNGSFNDPHVGPSDLAALPDPTPAEKDGGSQSSRKLDSAVQNVESPTPAELPEVGKGSYTCSTGYWYSALRPHNAGAPTTTLYTNASISRLPRWSIGRCPEICRLT